VDAECDLHLRLQRQRADQDGFDRHNKLHLELREPFNADHTAGCPYDKIVLFNVDSIGLGGSLPFTAPNNPEGAPGSDFEPGSWVAASIYQGGELDISLTLNPANSHTAHDFLPLNE
jgi:hypothetical protein